MPSASASGEPNGARAEPAAAGSAWRSSAARAAVACALLAALFWGLSRIGDPALRLRGSVLRPRPAPALSGLRDTRGRLFDWQAQRGSAVLVFFGYTHCPDVCPLTLARLSHVLDQLGPLQRDVRVVFVTLDPRRDTPRILRAYLNALLPAGIALRGDAADTARAATQWAVRWRRVDDPHDGTRPDDYWIDHTATVTLVGPHGLLRARYGYAQLAKAGLLLHDLRALLRRRAARA